MEQTQQLVLSPEAIQAIVQGLASNETLVSAIAEKVSNTRDPDPGRGSTTTTDASGSTQDTPPADLSNSTNSITPARPEGIPSNPPRGKLLLNSHIMGAATQMGDNHKPPHATPSHSVGGDRVF